MSEEKKYIRDEPVEKKGKMKWDKYQQRRLKLTKDAVLEYWTMPLRIEDGEPILKKTINLLEEGLNECKPNKGQGKIYKLGWQIQTDGRIYMFASSSKEDRNIWIKIIQDTFQSAKNAAKSNKSENTTEHTKKSSKKWGGAFKSFKETAKSGGMGSALKGFSKDAAQIKKSKFREKKEQKRKANVATLDTSSIFGCYLKDEQLKQEEIMEMKEQNIINTENDEKKKSVDDDENNVKNENPLIPITLNELLDENYQTFSSQLGAKASRFSKQTLFNDDLIVSNEFCQLAIGKGLVTHKKKEEKESDITDKESDISQDNEMENKENEMEEAIYLRVNKRPMDDTSDDEEVEDDNDLESHIVSRNEGNLREKIDFKPREYGKYPNKGNFTICCEIYCEDLTAGNTILSNRVENRGFEVIAPRTGSRRIAIWRQGSKLLNVGKTELFQDCWYHISIVCERANQEKINKKIDTKSVNERLKMEQEENTEKKEEDKKKKEKFKLKKLTTLGNMSGKEMMEKMTGNTKITTKATDFSVYLNGVLDGKLSLDGCPDLDTLECRMGSAVDMSMSSCFNGKMKHFEIYDCVLSAENINSIAHRNGMMSLQEPVLLSYIPQSLKVEIPNKNSIKYNGPMHEPLPGHLQWQPALGAFTISAYILCSRSVSTKGSVILSNLTTGNNGFELICPTVGTGVIGIRCTGVRDENGLSIGTTKIEKNKFYHIAVSVERIITYGAIADQTSIVVYLNGKQDGSYNVNTMLTYKGGDWTIGFNSHYKTESRFEGSISNVRLLQRSLTEAEISCLYAADLRERSFRQDEDILYCDTKQDGQGKKEADGPTNEHLTFHALHQWQNGKFNKSYMDGRARIKNKSGTLTTVPLNKIIKLENKISQFVPGTDSTEIPLLGGMIHGKDFNGNKWRIYSSETSFLRHITTPSCFTLLSKLKPFPKNTLEEMINNNKIDNKYIINRLLNAAHRLLKDINKNIIHKQVNGKNVKINVNWQYFNEYILPWNIWKKEQNFKLLQNVARRLQEKYKQQQFDLFDRLKQQNWDTFEIKNFVSDEIECRQDSFDGGLTTECNPDVIDQDLAQLYDQNVCSHILWGRCFLLNKPFQQSMEKIFENTKEYKYEKGPQKTYERMVEKTVEYQSENQKFPAAYKICDVLRCSVRCQSLNDVDDAYYALEKNVKIIRVKNRFLPSFDAKETDGYRDMLCNILFKDDKTQLSTIAEVQFHLQDYIDIKHKQHKYYKIVRAQNYKALLRNYEARKYDE